jgi:hypothetical protein
MQEALERSSMKATLPTRPTAAQDYTFFLLYIGFN